MSKRSRGLGREDWELSDASRLFPNPILHAKQAVLHKPDSDEVTQPPDKPQRQQRKEYKETDLVEVVESNPWEERDDAVELEADEIIDPDGDDDQDPPEPEQEQSESGEGDSEEQQLDPNQFDFTTDQPNSEFDIQDWEDVAERSASTVSVSDLQAALQRDEKDEQGHQTSEVHYNFDRYVPEMEIAFIKGRELIRKMAAEPDFSAKTPGSNHWDAAKIARMFVSYQHERLNKTKFNRPKEADIVMLMDISGSCAKQAEMFMAITAGAIGPGVRIHTGFNGWAKVEPLQTPDRRIPSYSKGLAWIQKEQNRQRDHSDSLTFVQFLDLTKPKTCIIFGDWDGRQEYKAITKYRHIQFFWFCNCGT